MKKHIYWTYILCLSVFMSHSCGSSSPVSPAQIPTEVSFASSESYGDGVVIQMGKSVTATADADFTDGEVVFTNSETGEVDSTGVCGTSSVDGQTITLTGPTTWPNTESQCSLGFLYDSSALPVQIGSANISAIERDISKADTSTAVDVVYDTSDVVLEGGGLEVTTATLQENAMKGSVSAYGRYVHACWLTMAQSGANLITDKVVYSKSADNGATWSTPVTIADLGSVTVQPSLLTYGLAEVCRIEAGVDSSGNSLVAAAIKYKDSDVTTTKHLELMISRDDGATWSSRVAMAEATSIADRVGIIIAGDVIHTAYGNTGGKHIVPCAISGSAATCYSGYTIAGVSAYNDDELNLAYYGSSIYAIYTDNSYSTGNTYNDVVIKALSYASGTYTVANTYQISSASQTTGSAKNAFIAADNNGRLVAVYTHANDYDALVAMVDTATGSITRGQINESALSEEPHFVKPLVSAANHYHFLYGYVSVTDAVYLMCDSSLNCANAVPISVTSLPGIESISVARDGRVYMLAMPLVGSNDLYTSGKIYLGRFTLTAQ